MSSPLSLEGMASIGRVVPVWALARRQRRLAPQHQLVQAPSERAGFVIVRPPIGTASARLDRI